MLHDAFYFYFYIFIATVKIVVHDYCFITGFAIFLHWPVLATPCSTSPSHKAPSRTLPAGWVYFRGRCHRTRQIRFGRHKWRHAFLHPLRTGRSTGKTRSWSVENGIIRQSKLTEMAASVQKANQNIRGVKIWRFFICGQVTKQRAKMSSPWQSDRSCYVV